MQEANSPSQLLSPVKHLDSLIFWKGYTCLFLSSPSSTFHTISKVFVADYV